MGSGIIMMSRTSFFVILGAFIIAGLLLVAGCTQSQAPTSVQTAVPTVSAATTATATESPATVGAIGMADPASVNCGKIGGTTDIKTAADGSQYGMCTFPNGTSCEEWALFRNEGCVTNVTTSSTTVTTTSGMTVTAASASK